MAGWILDYRKELDSDIWLLPPMYHRTWQWIKYKVNHAPARIPNRNGTFTIINPGQHATSYRMIAKGVGYYDGTKWKEPNPKTIKNILNWLESQGMIKIQGNSNGTVVTVVNWELYQSEINQGNSKRSAEKQALDTNNNDKQQLNNDINNNGGKSKRFVPPTLEEVTQYCKERNNTVNPQKFIDHYESIGWVRGKSKIKSWKACVRTWEQNSKSNHNKPQPPKQTGNKSHNFSDRGTEYTNDQLEKKLGIR